MSQLDSVKEELLAFQEAYVKEIEMLNDRIDALCIEIYKLKEQNAKHSR